MEYDLRENQRALNQEIVNGTTGLPENPDQPLLTLKVKDMNEGQSDIHQRGQNNGYARQLTPEERAKYEAIGQEQVDLNDEKDLAYTAYIRARRARSDHENSAEYRDVIYNDHSDPVRAEQIQKRKELEAAENAAERVYASFDKRIEDLDKANSEFARIQGEPLPSHLDPYGLKSAPPETPFKGDSWTNFLAKRSLREAVDEGKDIFAWPLNVSNGDAFWRSGNYYYEKMFTKAIEDLTKKAGVKVQRRVVAGHGVSKNSSPVHYAYVQLTPAVKKLLKEPMPLWMAPFLVGGGGAATVAGATQGLLSRRRSDEKA
jgi:hypothetical protein